MTQLQIILIEWYQNNKRNLPWRESPSAYHVWLSEVILQQTRVAQGLDYYQHFINKWHDVNSLAQADEEEILKTWQGLGYYSRARNLHKTAKVISQEFGGEFPADFATLRQLKGIGDYTAAAIASIAFGLPHAVLDGNVYRVLSRLFDIDTPINDKHGKLIFSTLAEELLYRDNPGEYNQALMDFGALQCMPKNPNCLICPLNAKCLAFKNKTTDQRPVKNKTLIVKTLFLYYLHFELTINNTHYTYIQRRSNNSIWEGLYDFPVIESETELSPETIVEQIKNYTQEFEIRDISTTFTHKLTHRTLKAQFFRINLSGELSCDKTKILFLTDIKLIDKYPFPRLMERYFEYLSNLKNNKTNSIWQV